MTGSASANEYRIEFMADPLVEALAEALEETSEHVRVERDARGKTVISSTAPYVITMDRATLEGVTGIDLDMMKLSAYVVCTVGGEIRYWNSDGFAVRKI